MTHLLLTVRFLDDRYHGLLDRGGPPEWPPSPFRLFQALVAGVARRGELVNGADVPTNTDFTPIGQALGWLQRHTRDHPPVIIAPKHKQGQAITRFVPNNDGDKKFDRQERLTAKPTIPSLFILDEDQKPEVHYVWPLPDNISCPDKNIERAARSLTALGWGIDMAFADARLASEDEVQKLKGIRWYPKKRDWPFHDSLRTPTYDDDSGECTLCDLRHCHSTFVNRIEHGKPLKTVDKPRIFDRVLYMSIERPMRRPHAIFKLVDEDEDTFRYPLAKLMHIAGMVRHLAIRVMASKSLLEKLCPNNDQANDPFRDGDPAFWIENPDEWVERVVAGHRDKSAGDDHQQFSYVPLPSIGPYSDAMIRNVMIVAPLGMERELDHLAERLDGLPLEPERAGPNGETEALSISPRSVFLQSFRPRGKFIDLCYLGRSRLWETVTPVILDGHRKAKGDNAKDVARTTERLIRKALARAGIEAPCEFTWQSIPFIRNTISARENVSAHGRPGYFFPSYLQRRSAVHVRLKFDVEVPGPITIGAGRHCGFGLFAAAHD